MRPSKTSGSSSSMYARARADPPPIVMLYGQRSLLQMLARVT
jgi:hypothetical protein